jgi:hypothetical protein
MIWRHVRTSGACQAPGSDWDGLVAASPGLVHAASKTVREEDVSAQMPCGPDVERHVAGIREFDAAGFTHVALVQIGGDTQQRFIPWAAMELLPSLRAS